MKRGLRAAVVTAATAATLVFANAAFAANTGSLAVSHTPMVLAGSQSTTIHVNVPQTTDPIAAVNIYSGTGYGVKLDQAAGTTIGSVDATAFSRDNNLTLPLSGNVVTSDPSTAANATGSAQCAGVPKSQAVWIMSLSVAGNTLAVPVYVNPTAGAEQVLGGYKLSICLPPPDVPVGTPGRAFQGAQLLDAQLTLNGVFTTPTGGGLIKWEGLFTPYNPGVGTVNRAGTFETRAFVGLPLILGIHASYVKKTNTYRLSGKVTEGGLAVPSLTLRIARGLTIAGLTNKSSTKTDAQGNWKTAGHLSPKKTTYFRISATVSERDYTATGCQSPITAVAPAGCVKATLPRWSATSVAVRVKR